MWRTPRPPGSSPASARCFGALPRSPPASACWRSPAPRPGPTSCSARPIRPCTRRSVPARTVWCRSRCERHATDTPRSIPHLHVGTVHRRSPDSGSDVPRHDGAGPTQVRRLMARRGAWTCAITLTAFALGGSLIFRLFGITIGAFKIAGGVLIGLNALDMVQARRSQQRETAVEKAEGIEKEDVGIMPLGVPMLAGPGAISTVMVLAGASKSVVTTVGVYVAIALTAFLTCVTLAAAPRVEQKRGETGMPILTQLMGLVLCAIAVQFIIDGIKMAGL